VAQEAGGAPEGYYSQVVVVCRLAIGLLANPRAAGLRRRCFRRRDVPCSHPGPSRPLV